MRIFIFLSLIALTACGERCKRLDGPRARYEQLLTPVSSLELLTPAEVVIFQDSTVQSQLEIFAQPEVYTVLETDVINRVCEINMDNCFKDQEAILINATFPALKRILFTSAGQISSGNVIQEDTLSLENIGLGDIDLTIASNQVTSYITSSGNILLAGAAKRSVHLSSGSGEVSAFNLLADSVIIHTIGTSVIQVYADDYLEVNFLKPTTVQYRGFPETIKVIGEGTLVNANL